MESASMSVIKYVIFIFNLIFMITGIGIIVTGALVMKSLNEYDKFIEEKATGPPIVLIVTGSIIMVIAFLGCCGAIRESFTLLMMFAAALVLIFIMELAVGIAAAVYKDNFGGLLREALKTSFPNSTAAAEDESSENMKTWHNIQQKLQCCGIDSPKDWIMILGEEHNLPSSCCRDTGIDYGCADGSIHVYQRGCFSAVAEEISTNAKILIGVGIGITIVEVVGIILACYLGMAIKREGPKVGE